MSDEAPSYSEDELDHFFVDHNTDAGVDKAHHQQQLQHQQQHQDAMDVNAPAVSLSTNRSVVMLPASLQEPLSTSHRHVDTNIFPQVEMSRNQDGHVEALFFPASGVTIRGYALLPSEAFRERAEYADEDEYDTPTVVLEFKECVVEHSRTKTKIQYHGALSIRLSRYDNQASFEVLRSSGCYVLPDARLYKRYNFLNGHHLYSGDRYVREDYSGAIEVGVHGVWLVRFDVERRLVHHVTPLSAIDMDNCAVRVIHSLHHDTFVDAIGDNMLISLLQSGFGQPRFVFEFFDPTQYTHFTHRYMYLRCKTNHRPDFMTTPTTAQASVNQPLQYN
jgi:hypothetical protein